MRLLGCRRVAQALRDLWPSDAVRVRLQVEACRLWPAGPLILWSIHLRAPTGHSGQATLDRCFFGSRSRILIGGV